MIEYRSGDLLAADADAIVNPVNCAGAMGRGLARQFRDAFPDNYRAYREACRRGEVRVGDMLVFETGARPRFVVNFPTKRHWRPKSRVEDLELGLTALAAEIARLDVRSVAVPALGCGEGGLDWTLVRPLIAAALEPLTDVRVLVYEPR